MFWLKNFRMSGIQLANTRCWAIYSNCGERPSGQVNADPSWVLPIPEAWWPDPGPAHLVDVIQFEVLEQKEQDSRNGFDDDLLVPIDIHSQLHALQHCGPGAHRGILGAVPAPYQPQRLPQRCLWAALPFPGLSSRECSQVLLHHTIVRLPRKHQPSHSPHDPAWLQTLLPSLPITTELLRSPSMVTHGISSGKTSARMLIESVLALDVGAAARRIFRRAIWGEKREMEKGVGETSHKPPCPTRQQRDSDTYVQREENVGT